MEIAASSSAIYSAYAAKLDFLPVSLKTAALVHRLLAPQMSMVWAEETVLTMLSS